jgi:hypothetical protein
MKFADLEWLVDQEHLTLCNIPNVAAAVRKYQSSVAKTWEVAGIYAYREERLRLVLEALHLRNHAAYVVRVYCEHPVDVLLARKSFGDLTKLRNQLEEARQVFIMHLPTPPELIATFEPEHDAEFQSLVYLPIPLPVSLTQIPD